jgi:hypothetical protein
MTLDEENAKRWKDAKRAFRAMWFCGTVGAFFAALTRSLPLHFLEASWPPDWFYTFDRLLRYGYLIWFLWYFIVSNINSQLETEPRRGDIPFDIIQSFAALFSAFALGFTVPGSGFGPASFAYAMAFANGAVLIICVASLVLFSRVPPTEVNFLRWIGLGASLFSIAIPWMANGRKITLLLFALSQAILWITLVVYTRMRLRKQPSEALGDA